jgi:hypothetical protein
METNGIKWIENVLLGDKKHYYETDKCPGCNATSQLYFNVEKFEYLKCKKCGTIFEKQRPTNLGAKVLYNSIMYDYFRYKVEIPRLKSDTKEKYSMDSCMLEILRNQLFSYIPNNNLILLDYASGLGVIADYYHKTGRFKDVYCYEINQKSIDFINQNFSKIKIYQNETRVNVVILYAALEHFSDPSEILIEIYKKLEPGGIIQIMIPYMGPITKNFFPNMYHMLSSGGHLNFFSAKGIKALAKRLNLKVLDIKYFGDNSQYLLKFIYSNKSYMTYKFIYDQDKNLEFILPGYFLYDKVYDSSSYGNFFIRTASKILNKLRINIFLKIADKGACMTVILKN